VVERPQADVEEVDFVVVGGGVAGKNENLERISFLFVGIFFYANRALTRCDNVSFTEMQSRRIRIQFLKGGGRRSINFGTNHTFYPPENTEKTFSSIKKKRTATLLVEWITALGGSHRFESSSLYFFILICENYDSERARWVKYSTTVVHFKVL